MKQDENVSVGYQQILKFHRSKKYIGASCGLEKYFFENIIQNLVREKIIQIFPQKTVAHCQKKLRGDASETKNVFPKLKRKNLKEDPSVKVKFSKKPHSEKTYKKR